MNRIVLFLFISVFCQNIQAQSGFVGWDTLSAKFRIDTSPFQFGGGPWELNAKSNLSATESFILSKTVKGFSGFQFDIQAIFHDKFGIETGFDFFGSSLNEKAIRSEFQDHISNYAINIPENDHQTGASPFNGGFDYRILKFGVVGFMPCRKLHFVPYFDYLYTIESDYPKVKVEFTDNTSSHEFTREYQFYTTSSNGFKLGSSIRGYFKNSNPKMKHTNLYMQLRAEFVYLKAHGYGYYVDIDLSNTETRSESHNFSQNIYGFVIGLTIGGLDLHW